MKKVHKYYITNYFNKILYILVSIITLIPSFGLHADTDKRQLEYIIRNEAGTAYYNYIKSVFEDFERENNVIIILKNISLLSTDDLHNTYIEIAKSGENTPDLMQIDAIRIPEFAELGLIADLSNYFPKEERNKFIPISIREVEWKNRIWAFPFFSAVGVVAYRKDQLDKNGFSPPLSWKRLFELAAQLQNKQLYGYVAQMAEYEGLVCNALEFIWSNGGKPSFELPVNLTAPPIIEGVQLMVDAVNQYKITPEEQLSFKEDEGRQLFLEGKALFARQWAEKWMSPQYDKYNMTIPKIDILPIPPGPSGDKGVAVVGGWAIAVNKKSKHLELAVKLAKYLTSEKVQKEAMLKWYKLPTRAVLYNDGELIKHYPGIKKLYSIISQAGLRPRSPFYPEISQILQKELHLALEKTITVRQALEGAERKMTEFLNSVKRYEGQPNK